MTHSTSTQTNSNSSEKENKNITFQPLLKISRTEQLVITHQEILNISYEQETVVVTKIPEEKPSTFEQKNIHLANARKNLDKTFEKHHRIREKKSEDESGINSGLDCSGQGMCQPNIEPSDNDTLQSVLLKANRQERKKKIKERLSKNSGNKT